MKNNFLGRSLRHITLICAIIVLSCATCSTRLFAHPITPVLAGSPHVFWAGGSTSFDPSTGLLSLTGGIVGFAPGTDPNGDDPDPLITPMAGGTVSIHASLTGTELGTTGIHADFGTVVGDPGWDVTITDSGGGIALAGDLGSLVLDGSFGAFGGSGAALFTPTTGYLLEEFPTAGVAGPFTFALDTAWSATSYTDAGGWSSGLSFGDVAPPVPEPGTIALLGTGLLGMLGYSRMRLSGWRRKK